MVELVDNLVKTLYQKVLRLAETEFELTQLSEDCEVLIISTVYFMIILNLAYHAAAARLSHVEGIAVGSEETQENWEIDAYSFLLAIVDIAPPPLHY